ncbi:acyltransferase family protein [Rhizobium leguminosarum]|uniref:acyltransferase family protein n=1 Tax=Rhizobium leguminosarum TaxID=384 RepID=UPI001DEECAAE|nr:peptidoglycan/LPS O-acetylase OafA/YrhL [Rhizobium leguminosarum]
MFFIFYDQWMPDFRTFGIIFDGTIAVHIFFVLSGFSLTINYFSKLEAGAIDADVTIRRMAVARYPRLAIPSLAACLMMYAVIKSGYNYYFLIPEELKQEWWRWAYKNSDVSFGETFKFALYSIFLPSPFIPVVPYNGPYLITNLWTMSIEFMGSMLVFIYALSVRNNKRRLLISIAITVGLSASESYFAHFFAGVVLADVFLKTRQIALPKWADLTNIAVITALLASRPGTFYSDVFFCALLVFAVSLGGYSRALFGSVPFRYLGSISFALYLVHMPVIVSVQSYFFLTYRDHFSQAGIISISGLASVIASLIAAHLFSYIDHRSTRLSQQFGRLITGTNPAT